MTRVIFVGCALWFESDIRYPILSYISMEKAITPRISDLCRIEQVFASSKMSK